MPLTPPHTPRNQKGLTLFEVTIAASLMGILTIIAIPAVRQALSAQQLSNQTKQAVINQKIANALQSFSNDPSRRLTETQTDTSALNPFSPLSAGLCNIALSEAAPVFCLPHPFHDPSNSYSFAIINPNTPVLETADPKNLAYHLNLHGVPLNLANDDNSSAHNVRVYQKLPSQQTSMPFLFNSFSANPANPSSTPAPDNNPLSASNIILDYDVAAIYSTNCPRANPKCNKSEPGSLPNLKQTTTFESSALKDLHGDSLLSDLTWTPPPAAIGPVLISTLPAELERLSSLRLQIATISQAIKNYASSNLRPSHCSQASPPVLEATNPSSPFFRSSSPAPSLSPLPKPTCFNGSLSTDPSSTIPDLRFVAAPSYIPSEYLDPILQANLNKPLTPQAIPDPIEHNRVVGARYGCYDGWYPLSSWASAIGITPAMSFTPWGGLIEYCADYSPSYYNPSSSYSINPSKPIAAAPHIAAIRFNSRLSLGRNPLRDINTPNPSIQSDSLRCFSWSAASTCSESTPHIIIPITP